MKKFYFPKFILAFTYIFGIEDYKTSFALILFPDAMKFHRKIIGGFRYLWNEQIGCLEHILNYLLSVNILQIFWARSYTIPIIYMEKLGKSGSKGWCQLQTLTLFFFFPYVKKRDTIVVQTLLFCTQMNLHVITK